MEKKVRERKREMGKWEREKERLNQRLTSHLSNIHETLQMLDTPTPTQAPSSSSSSLVKVRWDQVLTLSQQLSKNATLAGMLFTGDIPKLNALEENMEAFFNVLQGLLLLAHGTTVLAGPTLSSSIHASIKQVVDSTFLLWRECVASYGPHDSKQRSTIPQLAGTVWEACSALQKIPTSNIVAIGCAMTLVAVSMKDVLREMKELEPCSADPTIEAASEPLESTTTSDVDDNDEYDFGKDLSHEEMKIAQSAIAVVSEIVNVIKELIRSINGLLKKENLKDENDGVASLEKLLKLCQGIGVQVDELGACLYPPQEYSAIAKSCKEISNMIDGMGKELDLLNGSTEAFTKSCKALKSALEVLQLGISSALPADETLQNSSFTKQMQNLDIQD